MFIQRSENTHNLSKYLCLFCAAELEMSLQYNQYTTSFTHLGLKTALKALTLG